jgi:hypothetical protein
MKGQQSLGRTQSSPRSHRHLHFKNASEIMGHVGYVGCLSVDCVFASIAGPPKRIRYKNSTRNIGDANESLTDDHVYVPGFGCTC